MKNIGQSRRAVLFGVMATLLSLSIAGASNAATKPQKTGDKMKPPVVRETATFAAGCFWSMEAIFKQLKGIEKVEPGYSGGKLVKPSYDQVETGNTGHAEALNITYDPKTISYKDLLEVLLTVRNPTTLDKQGNDEALNIAPSSSIATTSSAKPQRRCSKRSTTRKSGKVPLSRRFNRIGCSTVRRTTISTTIDCTRISPIANS